MSHFRQTIRRCTKMSSISADTRPEQQYMAESPRLLDLARTAATLTGLETCKAGVMMVAGASKFMVQRSCEFLATHKRLFSC